MGKKAKNSGIRVSPVFPSPITHICPKQIYGNEHADSQERSRVTKITNNQIPMTNENDNDQFTNNQLNKAKGGLPVPFFFGYWLLSVFLVIGIWSLVIILLRRDQPRPEWRICLS